MHERVVAMIIDAIRSGVYSDGDRLPAERALAAEIGVSRSIVSAAIDELAAANVVESRRGRQGGTFVVSAQNIPAGLKRVEGPNRQVTLWLLEAREAIEGAAIMLAAERAQLADLRELRGLVDQLGELIDEPRAFAETGFTFVIRIAETSQNPFLIDTVRDLVNEQAALRDELPEPPSPDALRGVVGTFGRMLDAMVSGDKAEIRAAVAAHMLRTRGVYIREDA